MEKLSFEYIRGLVEGEGCFSFSTSPSYPPEKLLDGNLKRVKIPSLTIGMHKRDEELLRKVRNTLGLQNTVYRYTRLTKDGKTKYSAILVIREYLSIKDIVIPLFYRKLHGYKGKQFIEWLEKFNNSDVRDDFQYVYRLYKSGYYEKLLDKFN